MWMKIGNFVRRSGPLSVSKPVKSSYGYSKKLKALTRANGHGRSLKGNGMNTFALAKSEKWQIKKYKSKLLFLIVIMLMIT